MKTPLLIVALANGCLLLLAGLTSGTHANDIFVGVGLACLVLCLINFLVGCILLLVSIAHKPLKYPGLACLLFSALLLIGGFTLCSNASINVH